MHMKKEQPAAGPLCLCDGYDPAQFDRHAGAVVQPQQQPAAWTKPPATIFMSVVCSHWASRTLTRLPTRCSTSVGCRQLGAPRLGFGVQLGAAHLVPLISRRRARLRSPLNRGRGADNHAGEVVSAEIPYEYRLALFVGLQRAATAERYACAVVFAAGRAAYRLAEEAKRAGLYEKIRNWPV
jgi:hypothetical protein